VHRNIIWDLDGTLFDTYPAMAGAFAAALRDHAKDADPAWISSLATISFDHCVQTLSRTFAVPAAVIEEGFADHYSRVAFIEQPPFPGVQRVCEYIQGIGGQNVIVTHRGREGAVGLLEAHGMSALFTALLTQADGYRKKPHPESFEAAIRRYGLVPSETIGVGDRDLDVLAARGAGLFSCRYGATPGEEKADLSVTSYESLLGHLVRENGNGDRRR
jgi:phosphoglycolate phosphatase-like HAD superfamily hydrolase